MTTPCTEINALQSLETQFQEAALKPSKKLYNKALVMHHILKKMAEILRFTFEHDTNLAADLAEHILDFTDRHDLSGQWIDTAFDGTNEEEIFKPIVEESLEALARKASFYDRSDHEKFTL